MCALKIAMFFHDSLAIYGFHYVLCRTKNYHASAAATCVCVKCDQHMDLYHFLDCAANDVSLIDGSAWKR